MNRTVTDMNAPSSPGPTRSLLPYLPTVAIGAIILLAICLFQPRSAFWITDGGNKFLILHNLLHHHSATLSYPAGDIDPEGVFSPFANFHFVKIPDGIRSFYPGYFPALTAPFFHWGGHLALLLLSAAAGLGCALLAAGIARQLKFSPVVQHATILLLLLATPMLFYSVVFWEHALAVLLSTAAVYIWLRSDPPTRRQTVIAGLLMGCSCVLREEGYILLAAWGAALLIGGERRGRIAIFALAALCILLPLWGWQWYETGHPLGDHVSGYTALESAAAPGLTRLLLEKCRNYAVFLFQFNAGAPADQSGHILLLLPLVLTTVLGLCRGERFCLRLLGGCWLAGLAGLGVMVWRLYHNPEPVLNTYFTHGLLPGVPMLLILTASWPELIAADRRLRRLLTAAGIYLVLVIPLLHLQDPGIIWGPRHFLPLMPLLTAPLLAGGMKMIRRAPTAGRRGLLAGTVILSILLGITIQFRGIMTLNLKKNASAAIVAALSRQPAEVIVSDIFWLPEECASIFYRKKFMTVTSAEQLQYLTERLRRTGIKTFCLVLSANPQFRRLPRTAIVRLLHDVRIVHEQELASPGTGFMNAAMFVCRLP